ncbi:MAG: hypothetical protein Q8L24_02895 [bacterium]|nr:hypothetical protein [bacterium]
MAGLDSGPEIIPSFSKKTRRVCKQSGGGRFAWFASRQKFAEPLVVPFAAGANGHLVAIGSRRVLVDLSLIFSYSLGVSRTLIKSGGDREVSHAGIGAVCAGLAVAGTLSS